MDPQPLPATVPETTVLPIRKDKGLKPAVLIIVLLLVVVIAGAGGTLFLLRGVTPSPSLTPSVEITPTPAPGQTKVSLEAEYENPFDQKTQYVNPFSTYKNPFDNLK